MITTNQSADDEKVEKFFRGDDKALVLPFDGLRSDVSSHWHQFLKVSLFRMLHKTTVLGMTRYMSSGAFKNALLRSLGMKIGKDVFIAATVELDIQFPELITIEDGAILGMHSHISTHEVTHAHIRLGRVSIGKNAMVGGRATVRSGVTIGENSVVAMCAFVTEDVPPQTLVTGTPERKIVSLHSIL